MMIKSFMFFLLIISGVFITFTSSVLFRKGVDSLEELFWIYDYWVIGLILLFLIVFFEKSTKIKGGKKLRKFGVRWAFSYIVLSAFVLIPFFIFGNIATEHKQSIAEYDTFYYSLCVIIAIATFFTSSFYKKMDKKIDQDNKVS